MYNLVSIRLYTHIRQIRRHTHARGEREGETDTFSLKNVCIIELVRIIIYKERGTCPPEVSFMSLSHTTKSTEMPEQEENNDGSSPR